MNRITRSLALALVSFWGTVIAGQFPAADHNLVLNGPIARWDEAIPLGNGLTGGLLWGEKNTLRLSLDRGDLWDERTYGPTEWWKTQTWKRGGGMWEDAYHGPFPTKLPAGGVFITLPDGREVQSFELNEATAEGIAHLSDGSAVSVFFSATEPVTMMRVPGTPPKAIEVLDPLAVSARFRGGGSAGPDSHSVNALSYPKADAGTEKTASGEILWYRQKASLGLEYGVCAETRRSGNDTLIAIAVAATTDGPDWFAAAQRNCAGALDRGYPTLLASHAAWWRTFWDQSRLQVPDASIQNYYQVARYLYGAGSRADAPPMPLQGVWSAATGSLPPWHGDYHSDLNTQMTYIAYQEAGNLDEGASYINFLWNKRDFWRSFAHDFYETPGLSVPGVISLSGQPLGGWGAYSLSPTMTCWNAHLFYLHWLYSGDDAFMKARAYPWCLEAAECVRALLQRDAGGALVLPRSSSPEIGDNRYWPANTNYDLACIKMNFLAVVEMAEAQGLKAEAKSWRDAAVQLGDFHVAADGELLIAAGSPLRQDHRHLSQLIGIYPFNLITMDGPAADRQRIVTSLKRPEWNNEHHGAWQGYSWAWMACLQARVGNGDAAYHHLDVFVKAYTMRNGFQSLNDTSRMGFGSGGVGPFTLEGNFIAMQAVQEMLLQSWSPTPGVPHSGVIRLFPAMPWLWHDASFTDLRAEGGYKVSARRENNATVWLKVEATHAGLMRLRDNFGGRTPIWSRAVVKKVGDDYVAALNQGETLEATLENPGAVPTRPENAAEPIVITDVTGLPQNQLSLRIGADHEGKNIFPGDIARIVVAGNRALSAEEIASLANAANNQWADIKDVTLLLDGKTPVAMGGTAQVLAADGGLTGRMYRLDGKGWLEIPHSGGLNGEKGLTLAAWVRLNAEPPATGARIFDKITAGVDNGYLFDTYPKDSLRGPGVGYAARLPLGQWVHVAVTVDGKTGARVLYVNGKPVP